MMDHELIDQYRQGSADAFSEIVRRHVDWVYSAARRRVRDAHLAEDVTQAVFITLAQKKPHAKNGSLSPWLFAVLIRISRDALKRQAIRQRHESEAAKMRPTTTPDPQADWSTIAPNLEEAVAKLRYADQQAILLRFYEQLSFAEVATTLGITEEAARKRVSRATEKLRANLGPDESALSALSIAAMLVSHATVSAPPNLVASALSASLLTANTTVSTLVNSAKAIMFWEKIKVSSVVALAATVIAVGAATVISQVAAPAPAASTAPWVPATTPKPEKYSELWKPQSAIAKTLEARFTLSSRDDVREMDEYWTRMDYETGYLTATVRRNRTRPGGNLIEVLEDQFGFSDKVAWRSVLQRSGPSRRFDIAPVSKPQVARDSVLEDIGVNQLRFSYLPFQATLDLNLMTVSLESEHASDENPNLIRLTYRLTPKNAEPGQFAELVQDVDMMRKQIHRTEYRELGRPVPTIVNSNFKVVDGVSMAFESTQTDTVDPAHPIARKLVIQSIKFDAKYADGDFAPHPVAGDVVWDSILGTSYTVRASN